MKNFDFFAVFPGAVIIFVSGMMANSHAIFAVPMGIIGILFIGNLVSTSYEAQRIRKEKVAHEKRAWIRNQATWFEILFGKIAATSRMNQRELELDNEEISGEMRRVVIGHRVKGYLPGRSKINPLVEVIVTTISSVVDVKFFEAGGGENHVEMIQKSDLRESKKKQTRMDLEDKIKRHIARVTK